MFRVKGDAGFYPSTVLAVFMWKLLMVAHKLIGPGVSVSLLLLPLLLLQRKGTG